MKSIKCSLLLIILFFSSVNLLSQETIKELDRVYGPDQTLYNGKIYDYFVSSATRGNQFLVSTDYFPGTITLRGKCYQGLTLNYDIFNQELLLSFENERGALNIIEVSKAWIKRFTLGRMNFEYLDLGQNPQFYQVLGEGPVRILYYWRKSLKMESTIGSYYFTFTPPVRDSYILINGQLKRFSTKRNLIRLFDPVHRSEIKSYLRKNGINVKKASDQIMSEMITFIGNIK